MRWLCLMLVGAAGCGQYTQAPKIKAAASLELDCPAAKITVKQVSPKWDWYRAKGCKKSGEYHCPVTWKNGKRHYACWTAPRNTEDVVRREGSVVLKCEPDKLTLKQTHGGDDWANPSGVGYWSYDVSGCGRKTKMTCQPQSGPPWPDCYQHQ